MTIPKRLWQQTQSGLIVSIFTGQFGEILQSVNPTKFERARTFLPFIFWRWYFLQRETDNFTPYQLLKEQQFIENWPAGGLFLPLPGLVLTHAQPEKASCQIAVNLDFISFDDQPLIIDIRNLHQGVPFKFQFDRKYQDDLSRLAKITAKDETAKSILEKYFLFRTEDFYTDNPLYPQVFSLKNWQDYWLGEFLQIGQQEYGTDTLSDRFTRKMRKMFPEFGCTNEELKKIKSNSVPKIQERSHYLFWVEFLHHLLIPLSLYTNLLAPIFTDRETYWADIDDLLNNYYDDPMPMYCPPTALALTAFGQKIF